MKKLLQKIRFYSQLFPLRANFFLLVLIGIIAKNLFFSAEKSELDWSSTQAFVDLLLRLISYTLLAIIVLALVSTLTSYLLFRVRNKKEQKSLDLKISHASDQQNILLVQANLKNALRPVLGFVSGKLLLGNLQLSKAFALTNSHFKKNSLKIDALEGNRNFQFRDIKEYEIEGVWLYFEDMFRLIRLPFKFPMQANFYNSPQENRLEPTDISPKSTLQLEHRIEEQRKVEGDWLNYKQYEYGDDLRRIIWKIYGKNREIVIRKPETHAPFASELVLFASFHNSLKSLLPGSELANFLLNAYKNSIWTLFLSLKKDQQFNVEYVPEQLIPTAIEDTNDRVAYQIAKADWQENNRLLSYFNTKLGSVFCVHSLSNVDDLTEFLENGDSDAQIHVTYLSKLFEIDQKSWLKRIFLLDDANEAQQQIKTKWLLSPLRLQLLKNEEAIDRLLKTMKN